MKDAAKTREQELHEELRKAIGYLAVALALSALWWMIAGAASRTKLDSPSTAAIVALVKTSAYIVPPVLVLVALLAIGIIIARMRTQPFQ